MNLFKHIFQAAERVIDDFLFPDTAIMTRELRSILSSKGDSKKYMDALAELRKPEVKEVTIILETLGEITMTK